MSLLVTVLQTALKSRTKFDTLTRAEMVFIPDGEKFTLMVSGLENMKESTYLSDDLKGDPEANKLRMLLMQSGADIKGTIERMTIEVDFLFRSCTQTIFFIAPTGKKHFKKFNL